MAVLDDIRDGKGLKPITCKNDNCITSGEKIVTKCQGYKRKKTNADRIRAMSDEELAEFFVNAYWYVCKEDAPIDPETEECLLPSCKRCYLDWLKEDERKGVIL